MNKFGSDPKVKKTLVRNGEKKVKPSSRKLVVHDVGSLKVPAKSSSEKGNELGEPTLCSSETLANYLADLKLTAPPPSLKTDDFNVDQSKINAKMTKKLNFHYNDRIYRDLIELNANIENLKKKKDKRPTSSTTLKKDLEPNIEDFFEGVTDQDSPPKIPVIKPKYKMVKKVENGLLHQLVSPLKKL